MGSDKEKEKHEIPLVDLDSPSSRRKREPVEYRVEEYEGRQTIIVDSPWFKGCRRIAGGYVYGDDDDSLVVLDCDPENSIDESQVPCSASIEVMITKERGPVACRDFPHPRANCGRYIFNSTPHAEHCEMCHCYVCEIPAPCSQWNNGGDASHCHATEHGEKWNNMRKCQRFFAKIGMV